MPDAPPAGPFSTGGGPRGPAAADPAADGRFGRYEIERELGRGGMGVVYLAVDRVLGRKVALKVLTGEGDELIARFEREVRAVAALEHPNVLEIHDVGVESGRPFYTMRWVDGPSLADVLTRGPLPPAAALRIAIETGRALVAAHERGLIHRDIKPANILVEPLGDDRGVPHTSDDYRVLLTDFGLARKVEGAHKLTITGAVMGTPAYMSPEQASGEPVGPAGDQYSLAAVLYQLLAGAPPFDADNLNQLLLAVIEQDPASLPGTLSTELRAIVGKAMSKRPRDRYPDVAALVADLEAAAIGGRVVARPVGAATRLGRWARRHKVQATVAICALVALVGGAVFRLGPSWVEVDGRVERRWPSGRHVVRFRAAGFVPQETELVTLAWRTVRWDPPRIADHGFLVVDSTPANARLLLDVAGETRVVGRAGAPVRVPRGSHTLRLRAPDHVESTLPIHVPSGETVRVAHAMTHEQGTLNVTCEPPGVELLAAGGRYPLPDRQLSLPTGERELRFRLRNHFGASRTLRITRTPAPGPGASDGHWRRRSGKRHHHVALAPMLCWAQRLDYAASADPAVGDLDGDGTDDVVLVDAAWRLTAFDGDNGSKMWDVQLISAGVGSPALADFDGDGVLDVAVASGQWVTLYSGLDGSRIKVLRYAGPLDTPVVAVDIDGDRIGELAVSARLRQDRRSFLCLGTRDGQARWQVPIQDITQLRAADLDGDGRGELLGVIPGPRRSDQVVAIGADQRGRWRHRFTRGAKLTVADLDGDGADDVLVRGYKQLTACGGDGRERWRQTLEPGSPAIGVDLDGKPGCELVVVASGRALQARRAADGGLIWSVEIGQRVKYVPVAADFDGDGVPELACVTDHGRVRVYGRDGAPRWRFEMRGGPSTRLRSLRTPHGVRAVLVDSDRRLIALGRPHPAWRWTARVRGSVEIAPAMLEAGDERRVAVIARRATAQRLVCLDGEGAPLWRQLLPALPREVWRLPRTGGDDALSLTRDRLTCHAGDRGDARWSRRVPLATRLAVCDDLDGDGVGEVLLDEHGERPLKGRLVLLDGRTGAERWARDVDQGFATPPRVHGGVGAVALSTISGSTIELLELRTGKPIWRVPLPGELALQLAPPRDLDGDGSHEVVAALMPLRQQPGKPRGRAVRLSRRGVGWSASNSGRIIELDMLDLPDGPLLLVRRPMALTAVDVDSGQLRWIRTSGWAIHGVSLVQSKRGPVVVVSTPRMSSAFDAATGADRGELGFGPWIAGRGDTVFAAAMDGRVGRRDARFVAPTAPMLANVSAWKPLRALLDRGPAMPRHVRSYYEGCLAYASEQHVAAAAAFDAAVAGGARFPEVHVRRMLARLHAGQPLEPAIADATEAAALALAINPVSPADRAAIARAARNMPDADSVKCCLLAGDGAGALKRLERMDGRNYTVARLRALAWLQQGKPHGAQSELNYCIQLHRWDRLSRALMKRVASAQQRQGR